MNGSRMWVIATIVPVWLYIIDSRPPSSRIPSATSTLLTTPWPCSSTIQLDVRTSSEVQNGSSTRIISMLARRTGSVASRCATGKPSARQTAVIIADSAKVRRNRLT